ncbi:IPT/TIG domain-containing protein [Streptomyces cucumeris]|uniref:IPT/TIG domain-containing protein n=1 Tax=Streptomyces cucumeris TaxID=2962890 RepID=UPI003D707E55
MGVTPDQGPTGGGITVTVTGPDLAGATAVRFDGRPARAFDEVSATELTAVTPAGAGPVDVTVTTPRGVSGAGKFYYVDTPYLCSVTPDSGPLAGGNTLTIRGHRLAPATSVRFGPTAVTPTVVSDRELAVVAPANADEGEVAVRVVTPGGTSTGALYTYASAPTLTGLSPTSGTASGNTVFTLNGTNLSAATVTFDGVAATGITVNAGGTSLTGITPAGAAGPAEVTATTAGGTSGSLSFTYIGLPVATGISPVSGTTAGGTVFTLTGANLAGAAVTFNGVAATGISVNPAGTSLTGITPAGAEGLAVVQVTTPSGSTAVPGGFAYNLQ